MKSPLEQEVSHKAHEILKLRTLHINDRQGLIEEAISFYFDPLPNHTSDSYLDYLLEQSKKDNLAWDACCQLATRLMADPKALPKPLAEFVADKLKRLVDRQPSSRPNKGSGQETVDRDHALGMTVCFLTQWYDLSKYQNNERRNVDRNQAEPRSIIALVAEAANSYFENPRVTYSMVKTSWKTWRTNKYSEMLSDGDKEIFRRCRPLARGSNQ